MAIPSITGDVVVGTPPSPQVMSNILATIRKMESNNNYTAQSSGATASGAYQIINSTWKNNALHVPTAFNYATKAAKLAPPAVQDAVAAFMVNNALGSSSGHLAGVPVHWFWPIAWTDSSQLDIEPMGNPVTVRHYAERWLAQYHKIAADGSGAAGAPGSSVGSGGGGGSSGSNGAPTVKYKVGALIKNDDGKGIGIIQTEAGSAVGRDGGNHIGQARPDGSVVDDAGKVIGHIETSNVSFIDGVTDAIPGVSAIASVVDFLRMLADPQFLLRSVKVLGGVIAVTVGVVVIAKDSPTVQSAVSTAKGVAHV